MQGIQYRYMMSRTFTTGVAIAASLVVVALFFIFGNPFAASLIPFQTASPTGAEQLVVQDEVLGTGAVAMPGDIITVNYTGKLQNGTVFDTSLGRGPFQFILGAGQVIQGWEQGIAGMRVGGKRLLIVPPQLAYGADAYGPIPSNSTLVFEVELVDASPAANNLLPETPSGQ